MYMLLRLLTGLVCHVWWNIQPGFTCWSTIIFETLKDSCLKIDSLPLNICFSYRNVFQNGVIALSKMALKTRFFVKKLVFFFTFRTIRFGSNIASMWSKYTYQIMCGETLDLTYSVSICNGNKEDFQWQIYDKNWFSDRTLYVTITMKL